MRVLRALFIALFTAFVGCVLAFFVGDYLTRLAHVPEMEGQRGMTIVFLCAPLGMLAGFVIWIVSRRPLRAAGVSRVFLSASLFGGWTSLRGSMASDSNCSSSFVRRRHSKFQTSRMVTAFESVFTLTIGKVGLLSSTGTRSQKMPNM